MVEAGLRRAGVHLGRQAHGAGVAGGAALAVQHALAVLRLGGGLLGGRDTHAPAFDRHLELLAARAGHVEAQHVRGVGFDHVHRGRAGRRRRRAAEQAIERFIEQSIEHALAGDTSRHGGGKRQNEHEGS